MCLIAYVPKGEMLADDILRAAFDQNGHGIGVMSAVGVEKFLGKRALRKATRYLKKEVAGKGLAYAIHFRWATHGAKTRDNTHPFTLPDGKSQLMHNGIISWCGYDAVKSDTGVFADMLDDYPGFHNPEYIKQVEDIIGWGNKLCIMNADGSFSIANASAGYWIDGNWYSNDYSLPLHMQTKGNWYDTKGYLRDYDSYAATSVDTSGTGTAVTGRGNIIPFKNDFNSHYAKAPHMPTPLYLLSDETDDADDDGLDWDKDHRIALQRDDYADSKLAEPTGYREDSHGKIRTQADYYRSLGFKSDDEMEEIQATLSDPDLDYDERIQLESALRAARNW